MYSNVFHVLLAVNLAAAQLTGSPRFADCKIGPGQSSRSVALAKRIAALGTRMATVLKPEN